MKLSELSDDQLLKYFWLFVGMRKQSHREEDVKVTGADFKFLYHIVRIINEAEQIMVEGDLDLMRNREQLKSIRRGEWTEQQIKDYFTKKESELETVYNNSKLSWGPDEAKIKQLLLDCLETHYGSLEKCITNPDSNLQILRKIKELVDSVN